MLALTLAVVVAATPKLAAPNIPCADIPKPVCDAFGEHLVQQLGGRGLSVVSASDIANVLGLEKQKALMGCLETSCSAELAGALGVDGLVTGSIAAVGPTVLVNVRVISAKNGAPLATFSESVKGTENVPASLERAADAIVESVSQRPSTGVSKRAALIPGIAAVAFAGAAAACFGVAGNAQAELAIVTGADASYDPNAIVARGQTSAALGYVFTGLAVAGVAASVVLLVVGKGDEPPAVTVGPAAAGAGLAIGGTW
ncbi:MAG: hypothetical protein JNG84_06555 [Archangium sp.]|nr:hypothetical protein [Archangium sp.]